MNERPNGLLSPLIASPFFFGIKPTNVHNFVYKRFCAPFDGHMTATVTGEAYVGVSSAKRWQTNIGRPLDCWLRLVEHAEGTDRKQIRRFVGQGVDGDGRAPPIWRNGRVLTSDEFFVFSDRILASIAADRVRFTANRSNRYAKPC